MNRHSFPKYVVVTNDELRGLPAVGECWSVFTDTRKLEDVVVAAQTRRSLEDDVGCDAAAVSHLDSRADDRPGANVHIGTEVALKDQ